MSAATDVPQRHAILSLGAGVQSTTLALMALRGELPLPEAAIFADTGWESAATYAHLDWLTRTLGDALPVHVVRRHRPDGTPANIRDDALAVVAGALSRLANPPLFVKGSRELNPSPLPAAQARFERKVGGKANFVVLPLFARHFTGKVSMLRRQCTGEYKIEPTLRKTRELVGRRPGTRRTLPPFVEMWIGISADEAAKRCKPSREPWVSNRYPLRELGMGRRDCEDWLWRHYRLRVPKSSCIGCPFHDDRLWREMKRQRPDEWQEAIAFDRAIRHLPMVQGEVYVHRSCVPLDQVDLRSAEERGQLSFSGALFRADGRAHTDAAPAATPEGPPTVQPVTRAHPEVHRDDRRGQAA
jgi:hypothetical protein